MSNRIEEIKDKIKADIKSGKLGPSLPTRREMRKIFNTTIETIGKVVRDLEIEGVIVSRGKKLRVNMQRERINSNNERFADLMKAQGHHVIIEHLKTPGVIEAPLDIAKIAGWPIGTKVIERMRREIINGSVYRYSRKVYLAELVPPEHLAAMQADYTYNIRREMEEQRPLSRIVEQLIARVITEKEEAEILGTIKGAPVLEQWKLNYDKERQVTWVSIVVFNAQYFVKQFDYEPGNEPRSTTFPEIY
ncbi:MAG TPA: GntR family transcriptional regulator [Ktedonobacteraceae bacterium]|nr:GntR family transcriptional regulator [Ktedonobacteraceae bacterium]